MDVEIRFYLTGSEMAVLFPSEQIGTEKKRPSWHSVAVRHERFALGLILETFKLLNTTFPPAVRV